MVMVVHPHDCGGGGGHYLSGSTEIWLCESRCNLHSFLLKLKRLPYRSKAVPPSTSNVGIGFNIGIGTASAFPSSTAWMKHLQAGGQMNFSSSVLSTSVALESSAVAASSSSSSFAKISNGMPLSRKSARSWRVPRHNMSAFSLVANNKTAGCGLSKELQQQIGRALQP